MVRVLRVVLVLAFLVPAFASAADCPNLLLGSKGAEVTRLQTFFHDEYQNFTSDYITGFFGPVTQTAVQQWQRTHNIVSSGTPDTTGYGLVGPRTRAAMGIACSSDTGSTVSAGTSVADLIRALLDQVKALQDRLAALRAAATSTSTTITSTSTVITTPVPVGTPNPTPSTPAPTITLKANGSDGPVTATVGGSVTWTWSSQNASSCKQSYTGASSAAPTEWGTSGSKVIGPYPASAVGTYVVTMTCTGSGGTASDTLTLTVAGAAPNAAATPIDLFLIAGQSNANGMGDASLSPVPTPGTVLQYSQGAIFDAKDPVGSADTGSAWPSFGITYHNQTGHLVGFVSAAKPGTTQVLATDQYQQGFGSWDDGGQRFGDSVTEMNNALAAFRRAGYEPTLRGIVWNQGESEAVALVSNPDRVTAADYEAALRRMLDKYRATFGSNVYFFNFELGTQRGYSDTTYALIRAAQERVAASDARNPIVFSGALGFLSRGLLNGNPGAYNPIHYTQAGLNEMGTTGATNAIAALGISKSAPTPLGEHPSVATDAITYSTGGRISATWKNPAGAPMQLALVSVVRDPTNYAGPIWGGTSEQTISQTSISGTSGTATLSAPSNAGPYQLVMKSSAGELVRSRVFQVGTPPALSVYPSSGTLPLGVLAFSYVPAGSAYTVDFGNGASQPATFCAGTPTCTTPGMNNTIYRKPGTYTVRLLNGSGAVVATAVVNVADSATPFTAMVDLKGNGSDGPVNAKVGGTVTWTWTSHNVISCAQSYTGAASAAPTDWGTSGTKVIGPYPSSAVGSYVITMTCKDLFGSTVTDTVPLNVTL